ncbi:hypothetical protein OBBRIDRAFT_518278 [Obba rivulosa]|uniref:Uncharacterized protein n=1 Tax=Obba rivulosa TaxID=1052685 RepID=A0A8E2AV87_9APHY|nr:hypothetical protein OBBRIDRAFT_518278 [Obba rivulosa]
MNKCQIRRASRSGDGIVEWALPDIADRARLSPPSSPLRPCPPSPDHSWPPRWPRQCTGSDRMSPAAACGRCGELEGGHVPPLSTRAHRSCPQARAAPARQGRQNIPASVRVLPDIGQRATNARSHQFIDTLPHLPYAGGRAQQQLTGHGGPRAGACDALACDEPRAQRPWCTDSVSGKYAQPVRRR